MHAALRVWPRPPLLHDVVLREGRHNAVAVPPTPNLDTPGLLDHLAATLTPEQLHLLGLDTAHTVYYGVLPAVDGSLRIYVGKTGQSLSARLYGHVFPKPSAFGKLLVHPAGDSQVCTLTVFHCPTLAVMDSLEAHLIERVKGVSRAACLNIRSEVASLPLAACLQASTAHLYQVRHLAQHRQFYRDLHAVHGPVDWRTVLRPTRLLQAPQAPHPLAA